MCNACGFHCCASDEFSGCGCDECPCEACWSACEVCGLSDDLCDCYHDDCDDGPADAFECDCGNIGGWYDDANELLCNDCYAEWREREGIDPPRTRPVDRHSQSDEIRRLRGHVEQLKQANRLLHEATIVLRRGMGGCDLDDVPRGWFGCAAHKRLVNAKKDAETLIEAAHVDLRSDTLESPR